jgi:mono/diheme cytochrome c family protein
VLLALSTSHEIGLAGVAAVFIAFALASALLIPRWRPDFPGANGRKWFILATLLLFAAMLFAVETFAKEEEEGVGHEAAPTATETGTGTGTGTTQQPAPQPPAQGDAAAGKAVFDSQGCSGCHTFTPAGAKGTVGPNLDEVLKGKDAAFIRESIVNPNAEIAQGFQPNIMPQDYGQKLSDKQLNDLVAFLSQS